METFAETLPTAQMAWHAAEVEPAQILVVDGNDRARRARCELLEGHAYRCVGAASSATALEQLTRQQFDLILIDLELSGTSGMPVAQQARQVQPDAKIILLTAHGTFESALESMHLGVFDYLLKTECPSAMLARIDDAIATRREERRKRRLLTTIQAAIQELSAGTDSEPRQSSELHSIVVGPLQISPWRHSVRIGDREVRLTSTELHVLACLAQRAGQPLTYQQIAHAGLSSDVSSEQAAELIKPHIYHLRQKLEQDPSNPHYILTVRGVGYLLAME
jgi:DNA-binding response OmpR family regulator